MKRQILLMFLFVFSLNVFASDDPLGDSKKLGLVSYITYIKHIAEAKMSVLASDPKYQNASYSEKVKKMNSNYNLLRLAVDKLINQLSADLFATNKLGLYKNLNSYLKTGKGLKSKFGYYEPLIEEIDGLNQALMIKTYASTLGGTSLEEITGIITLGHDIITDARDFREKKIQSLTTLLKDLHLLSLAELVKPKEKSE